ncbi:MAG: peptidoglycan bridge formation glycyltransferase FemA/FemB family protein [Anaerolineaceae bacterium]|nr:peptidoglycan bridge formation glycyltransferase FemA/FemB family protein [Anaerolineaceae bacterium]
MTTLKASEWDLFLAQYPDAHLLQTSAWGEFKAEFGWSVERVYVGACGAQILFRQLPLGMQLAYIPKGPIGEDWADLWPEIERVCRIKRVVILKVEPDLAGPPQPNLEAQLTGFHPSEHTIQPRRTIIINLDGEEDQLLARLKQKTRYNIRLAEKKDIQVHVSQDLDAFYQMMSITGQRDGFGVHSREYFHRAYQMFHPDGMCELLIAEYGGRPLAGLMVFKRGKRA